METVKSADGTVIAYDLAGSGPPLVVVVGAFCDRRTFVPPAALTSRFTVCTWDRRGRGDSGDTQPYSPAREIEDLAAVIGAAGAGSAPFVFGHSSGAALALLAAAAGVPLAGLVAYEAPWVIPGTRPLASGPAERITALVAAGRRDEAVRYWMTDVVRAPAAVTGTMESWPSWAGLQAMAHTLVYDLALTGDQGVPADDLARITAPALVLGGANSPDWFHRTVEATAAAIPGARLLLLDGQDHGAPPELIATVLTDFFLGSLPVASCGGEAWLWPWRLPAGGSCRSRATRWTAGPSCCATGRSPRSRGPASRCPPTPRWWTRRGSGCCPASSTRTPTPACTRRPRAGRARTPTSGPIRSPPRSARSTRSTRPT